MIVVPALPAVIEVLRHTVFKRKDAAGVSSS